MSLAEKLDAIRARGAKRIAPERRAVMLAATKGLRESGIAGRAIKVGDPLPEFSLNNTDGVTVRSTDLLAKGAVVLTVFRGKW
jgi:hypothetical protein